MVICGIKASHDGGVAVIEDGRLLFSIEMEKLGNRKRYSPLDDLRRVNEILASEGMRPQDVDRFVVDGWWDEHSGANAHVLTRLEGRELLLPVAPYVDGPAARDPLSRYEFQAHQFAAGQSGYVSYHHVANHLAGAYCTSPFAARGADALIMVWDGGMVPRLYHVDAVNRVFTFLTVVMPLTGNSFSEFCEHFGPYRLDPGLTSEQQMDARLSIAGKAMAYAALGRVEKDAYPVFETLIASYPNVATENAGRLGAEIAARRGESFPGLTDADLIATFQAFLGDKLIERLRATLRQRARSSRSGVAARTLFGRERPSLVIAGGCALNIKWNNALRESGLFDDIWVPPFPNDAGAAIGAAACELLHSGGPLTLDWNVYSGPRLMEGPVPAGWSVRDCHEAGLAALLHEEGEPVVVLSGRAELGPRALGNRSILAPATSAAMKDELNRIKDRASYRPVAPICLTSRASEVFAPGGRDPYMLFEHRLQPGWGERLPAIVHLDGTARLQTLDEGSGCAAARILAAYERVSGIPVLCNTSANLNGKGFFPDVSSAAAWGGTRRIWSEGLLYTNERAAKALIRAESTS